MPELTHAATRAGTQNDRAGRLAVSLPKFHQSVIQPFLDHSVGDSCRTVVVSGLATAPPGHAISKGTLMAGRSLPRCSTVPAT